MPTDARIEAVARAIYGRDGEHKWELAHPFFREVVLDDARAAIAAYVFGDSRTLGFVADAAIRCVIEALAAEAEREYAEVFFAVGTPEDMAHGQMDLADWLRAHLDAGRDGEAGR